MPIWSMAAPYFGNVCFNAAMCVAWSCFHLEPQEASANLTAMAWSEDIFCKKSIFNCKLFTAR